MAAAVPRAVTAMTVSVASMARAHRSRWAAPGLYQQRQPQLPALVRLLLAQQSAQTPWLQCAWRVRRPQLRQQQAHLAHRQRPEQQPRPQAPRLRLSTRSRTRTSLRRRRSQRAWLGAWLALCLARPLRQCRRQTRCCRALHPFPALPSRPPRLAFIPRWAFLVAYPSTQRSRRHRRWRYMWEALLRARPLPHPRHTARRCTLRRSWR
mmetsp:Transcript_19648/g.58270  ORF Transcript_19648/g.58270 Transcript_19648/m.58270 type:complete len:208 (-) Transcript_19648:663-1286(-)